VKPCTQEDHKTQQALLKAKNCCYQAKGMLEFYELTECEKNQTEKTSTHQMGLKGDATWNDFQCLHKLEKTNVGKLIFAAGSAEQENDPMK
jgi:hypothetical protein